MLWDTATDFFDEAKVYVEAFCTQIAIQNGLPAIGGLDRCLGKHYMHNIVHDSCTTSSSIIVHD